MKTRKVPLTERREAPETSKARTRIEKGGGGDGGGKNQSEKQVCDVSDGHVLVASAAKRLLFGPACSRRTPRMPGRCIEWKRDKSGLSVCGGVFGGKCLHDGNSIYAHMCMVYIHTHTHTHTHTHIYIYIHTHMYISIYISIYTHTHTHILYTYVVYMYSYM